VNEEVGRIEQGWIQLALLPQNDEKFPESFGTGLDMNQ
jgi:hypothetical protein